MMLFFKKKDILRSLSCVAVLTLMARILGIFQDKFLVSFFGGATAESDAFLVSFRIPNFLRRMISDGIISAGLLPVVVGFFQHKKKERGLRLLTLFFGFTALLLSLLSVLIWYKPLLIIWVFAPGLDSEQLAFVEEFIPRMFFLITFLGICEYFNVGLRSVNHFITTAIGPSVYHVVMIVAVLLAQKYSWPTIYLAWAVSIGGFVKLVLRGAVFYWLRLHFTIPCRETFKDALVVCRKIFPLLLGFGFLQTYIMVEGIIGSFLPVGDISIIHYAFRFFNIPMMVLTTPVSSVMLPYFTNALLKSKLRAEFLLVEMFKFLLWVSIPLVIELLIHSSEIFALFYGQAIDSTFVVKSSTVFKILSCGLPFYLINQALVTLFYGLRDTFTPTRANIVSTAQNAAGGFLSLYFFQKFAIFGIGFSSALSFVTSTILLLYLLCRKHNICLSWSQVHNFAVDYTVQLSCFFAFQRAAFSILGGIFVSGWTLFLVKLIFLNPYPFLILTRRRFNVRLFWF